MNRGARSGRNRSLRRRARRGVALIGVFGATAVWCSAGVAQAAVSTFSLSPASGPPGTVVQVSGTGCTPGLLASMGTDFVTLTATTLNLAVRAPVAANGSWQASFTVPASAIGLVATPIAAVCVSSGIQSLGTIYTPQLFRVTPPATTTTGPTPGTGGTGGSAPPPASGASPGREPTTPRKPQKPKPTATPGSTIGGPSSGNDGGGAAGAPGAVGTVTIGTAASIAAAHARNGSAAAAPGKRHAAASVAAAAATLQPAELGAALTPATGSGGLRWLPWLLLIALALAVVGVPAWLWHSRRSHAPPRPGGERA